jgi:hypothetical protein
VLRHNFNGGGGSYLDQSFSNTSLTGGANSRNGYVDISLVEATSPVPEPNSAILLMALVAGLGLARRLIGLRMSPGRSPRAAAGANHNGDTQAVRAAVKAGAGANPRGGVPR